MKCDVPRMTVIANFKNLLWENFSISQNKGGKKGSKIEFLLALNTAACIKQMPNEKCSKNLKHINQLHSFQIQCVDEYIFINELVRRYC